MSWADGRDVRPLTRPTAGVGTVSRRPITTTAPGTPFAGCLAHQRAHGSKPVPAPQRVPGAAQADQKRRRHGGSPHAPFLVVVHTTTSMWRGLWHSNGTSASPGTSRRSAPANGPGPSHARSRVRRPRAARGAESGARPDPGARGLSPPNGWRPRGTTGVVCPARPRRVVDSLTAIFAGGSPVIVNRRPSPAPPRCAAWRRRRAARVGTGPESPGGSATGKGCPRIRQRRTTDRFRKQSRNRSFRQRGEGPRHSRRARRRFRGPPGARELGTGPRGAVRAGEVTAPRAPGAARGGGRDRRHEEHDEHPSRHEERT